MPYASFRCQVDAPLPIVWDAMIKAARQSITPKGFDSEEFSATDLAFPQAIQLTGRSFQEAIQIDAEKNLVTLRLIGGQSLAGERRFRLIRAAEGEGLEIESQLDWLTGDKDFERQIFSYLDVFVRDLALEMKKLSEEP